MTRPAILLLALLILGGCVTLKDDSAILGSTGFWVKIGLNPALEVGGIPLPSLQMGYGTFWRIGGDRDVTVTVGATGEIKASKAGEGGLAEAKTGPIPTLKGMSSLHITAKNRTKMKDADENSSSGSSADPAD